MAEKSNMQTFHIVTSADKSYEWFTPVSIVEAVREVMGTIDLDPASCELANQIVKATHYYSKEENGLDHEWKGKVFLNPPYGKTHDKSNQSLFIYKLIQEYTQGNVEQAILLTTAKHCTPWFKSLWEYPICFVGYEVKFKRPKSEQTRKNPHGTHVHGTALVYLGKNEHKFINTFSQFGRIAKAIDTPRRVEKPIPLWDAERIYA